MSVTAPPGFRAAGLAAGIKASGRPDLAVVLNDGPATAAAGVFTANRVCAAPVTWTRQVVSGGQVRAVVLNSGCANACTGSPGLADTTATAQRLAAAVSAPAGQIAVCSTGLIGERLPMDKLLPGVDAAVAAATADGGAVAAEAIMTTDTVAKTCCVPGPGYLIGGMAKGAAMLAPGLATMLAVLTTDAAIPAAGLRRALAAAVRTTFAGSTPTAACPPTTPCWCCPAARRRRRTTVSSPGCSPPPAPTWPGRCSGMPRVPPRRSRSR